MTAELSSLCLAGKVFPSGATWCCNLPKGHGGDHDDGLGEQWGSPEPEPARLAEEDADRDAAYVTGLFAVEQWLAQHASSPRPGFDPATCWQLAAGAHAMLLAVVDRLGVNPDGCDATDWAVADEAARDERRRVEVERIDGGMS